MRGIILCHGQNQFKMRMSCIWILIWVRICCRLAAFFTAAYKIDHVLQFSLLHRLKDLDGSFYVGSLLKNCNTPLVNPLE